jgi:hypothetical protein
MATTYEKCDEVVNRRVRRLIQKHYPDLQECEARIDCLFARNGDGPAVKLHGYACLAVVRKTSLKQRVLGLGDAEIVIDEKAYEDLTETQRDALLDHEIYHLEVQKDEHGYPDTDDAGRPKLKLKLHDWELGGFAEIAQRYGSDAPEVKAAQDFQDKFGQYVFGFAHAGA